MANEQKAVEDAGRRLWMTGNAKAKLEATRAEIAAALPESMERSTILLRLDEAILYMPSDDTLDDIVAALAVAEAGFAKVAHGYFPQMSERSLLRREHRDGAMRRVLGWRLPASADDPFETDSDPQTTQRRLDPSGWLPDDLYTTLHKARVSVFVHDLPGSLGVVLVAARRGGVGPQPVLIFARDRGKEKADQALRDALGDISAYARKEDLTERVEERDRRINRKRRK